MQPSNYSEFMGISPQTSSLIERFRISDSESKDTILYRILSSQVMQLPVGITPSLVSNVEATVLDLGQGAELIIGEKMYLFLSVDAKKAGKSDGRAIVRRDGLEVEGKVLAASRGSYLQPAMVYFQKIKGDVNNEGEPISRSAWRQWHVIRRKQLTPVLDIKKPEWARTRGRGPGKNTEPIDLDF